MTARTLDLDKLVLGSGGHQPADTIADRNACVMEAVAWVAGEPWSDHPACASVVIGAFLRDWNDALDDGDRQQLRRWVLPVVGTAASDEIEDRRAWMATDWLVRTCTPAWLRLGGLTDDAAALEALPELTADALVDAAIPIIDRARAKAAESAAWSAVESAAVSAVESTAWSAVESAVESTAVSAVESAAWSAARSAALSAVEWSAAVSAAWSAAVGSAVESTAVSAAVSAVGSAAWSAAWSAALSAVESAVESAAVSAAVSAVESALRDTVVALQASAHDLIGRMVALSPGGAR